ncbi:non-hydrolyzing UDP-N-acetylglucosamine 2-epimerase [Ectobacillus ponti]|uniref:UDP-N-acetylglucosamine 2-epimerase (Non-hydrolyzing) n=1 Tax=Ectobacillus ponti TaxID=2961894 RepID=A0AA42BP30_9BACI|nr:UDP-N-acetylglucosamine 2-epimerase (non-hydrolyzing) [Ectobacillus ponti]MCP8968337.1 UDP-N-acetylglucosamine 2-epimerase (non-hydrolyzing) [Ectobacillus ponti]
MKVATILGTRPELIRLSVIIHKLDQLAKEHILIHTGQNYTDSLSSLFFRQMDIRDPDYRVQLTSHAFGPQTGQMFQEVGSLLEQERPDCVLVLGDTNSALCAIVAERMGIPVYHMEAGNRCHDMLVPEEKNRRVIDAVSTYNLPYTMLSRENLLREGMHPQRIWVSGNPIYEVMQHYKQDIQSSTILEQLQLGEKQYMVVTAHRAENVDRKERLQHILAALEKLADEHKQPIICSWHPRTRARMAQFGLEVHHPLIQLMEPIGFFDFVKLQQHARCIITDSGTVQEESCILGVPSVTIRNSTERPETIMCGSNVLSGLDAGRITDCVNLMLQVQRTWELPEGYGDNSVSDKVVSMILGGVNHV